MTQRQGALKQRPVRPVAKSSAVKKPSQRKPPRRRWSNLRPLLVIVGVFLLLVFGVWAFWFSSLADVRKVDVRGLTGLQADQVRQVAAVSPGEPLARVDLDAVRGRVASIPRVASVSVSRQWPHGIRITVRERTAALVVPDHGRFAEVDADGVRFGSADKAPGGVPVVDADADTVSPETLRGVGQVVRTLPGPVAERLRGVAARSRDDIRLTLDKDVTVLWGGAQDSARKAAVLGVLLEQQRKAKVFDVSVPDAPVTRTVPPPPGPPLPVAPPGT